MQHATIEGETAQASAMIDFSNWSNIDLKYWIKYCGPRSSEFGRAIIQELGRRGETTIRHPRIHLATGEVTVEVFTDDFRTRAERRAFKKLLRNWEWDRAEIEDTESGFRITFGDGMLRPVETRAAVEGP